MTSTQLASSQVPIEPIQLLQYAGDMTVELTTDAILALQHHSGKKVESVAFVCNSNVQEQEFIKPIIMA